MVLQLQLIVLDNELEIPDNDNLFQSEEKEEKNTGSSFYSEDDEDQMKLAQEEQIVVRSV